MMTEHRIRVPGSKSITQRALVAAALAPGTSRLMGPLESEDTLLLKNALESVGIRISTNEGAWDVHGQGGQIELSGQEIFMGNNGTGIRFMTSVMGLGRGCATLTGTKRMSERPIQPLLDALRGWGVDAQSIKGTGCPPVRISSQGLPGGKTHIVATKSSQFLSSLLLVAPCARSSSMIELDGLLVSRPYIDITLAVMKAFGADVKEDGKRFMVQARAYRPTRYQVEGDASSASYFWAAAAIGSFSLTVENIGEKALQGDAAFVDILEMMGCKVRRGPDGTTVRGPAQGKELEAIEIDMSRWPDIVPTLAVVAAFAKGTTVIKNVAHLRIKETDRLKAVASELRRMGGVVEELADGLRIKGQVPMHGATIETYDDHRIAMSFAVAGRRVPGTTIKDPECVKKSFPGFWNLWKDLPAPETSS